MRDRKKCARCVYRGSFSGVDSICNYSGKGETCLHRVGNKIVDRRGTDPKNCLLFKEGYSDDFEGSKNEL